MEITKCLIKRALTIKRVKKKSGLKLLYQSHQVSEVEKWTLSYNLLIFAFEF